MTTKRPTKPPLEIGVLIQAAAWRRAVPDAARLATRAARAAFAAAVPARIPPAGAEAAVVLADDQAVRALNRRWRRQDKPTNVLAFVAADQPGPALASGAPLALGDVVVALETARGEAKSEGKRLADHLSHLIVHGMLHLLGRDHRTAAQAERMERLETRILAGLGVADPYAPRTAPRTKPARRRKPAR